MGITNKNQFDPEDKLLKDLFQQSAQVPSSDMKGRIMLQVQKPNPVLTYEPVISKRAWFVIATCFTSVMAYLFYKNYEEAFSQYELTMPEMTWLTDWTFSTQKFINLFDFSMPSISISFTAAVALIVVFGVYFMISFKSRFFHTT